MKTLFLTLLGSLALLTATPQANASVYLIGYECPTEGRMLGHPTIYVRANESWVVMRGYNGVWEQVSRPQGKQKTSWTDKEIDNTIGYYQYAVIPASEVSTFVLPAI